MSGSGVDWRLLLMLPPKRRFEAEELARAIPEPPSRELSLAVALNIAFMVVGFTLAFGRQHWPVLLVLLLALGAGTAWGLHAVWRDPGNRVVRTVYYLGPLLCGVVAGLGVGPLALPRDTALALLVASLASVLCLWFAMVYRHRYVLMRLAELDERDRAVEMARRLAAAQIQPHFLFNSLATLQHWVAEKDDRALPMLEALNGYLRATLPLFDRARLPLSDEVAAVRRYLQVMQMRLGERLLVEVDIDEAALRLEIPPGLLLTLTENAVEHGVAPSLRPVTVQIRARREGPGWLLQVADDGAGLLPADGGVAPGLGLANTRLRLLQAFGEAASLSLDGGPGWGCTVRILIPDHAGTHA